MSYYTASIVFMDDKNITVSVREEEKDKFFECMYTGKPFEDSVSKCGFFLQFEKVRYITFVKVDPPIASEPTPE